MWNPENDGFDHINIYSKSKTFLGRMMSNFSFKNIIIEGLEFSSIEAYWYWLSTGRQYDFLRKLSGFKAKQEGKKYPIVQVDNFEELICKAIRIKVESWIELKEHLIYSELPFAHYYVFGDNSPVVKDAGSKWIVEEWEKIRKELKELK